MRLTLRTPVLAALFALTSNSALAANPRPGKAPPRRPDAVRKVPRPVRDAAGLASVAAGRSSLAAGRGSSSAAQQDGAGKLTGKAAREAARARLAQPAADAATDGPYQVVVPKIAGRLPRTAPGNRGLAILLADQSSSMEDPFPSAAPGTSKASALAEALNATLNDLIETSSRSGEVQPKLDVETLGYRGATYGAAVTPLLRARSLGIEDLPAAAQGLETVTDAEGKPFQQRRFVTPRAEGKTPMSAAYRYAATRVAGWTSRPKGPHLVLVVNVTDGEPTDGEPIAAVRELNEAVTSRGGALLNTVIHISSVASGKALVFPTAEDVAGFGDPNAARMFELASPVPDQLAQKLGIRKPGARMMAYNVTGEDFLEVLRAGSSAAAE